MSTAEDCANPIGEFVSSEQPLGLNYLTFAMNPLRLDRIEPRTLGGQQTWHYPDPMAAGGPLARVRTGDPIELDVPNRRLELLVDEAELEHRRAAWKPPEPYYGRGYGAPVSRHVTQANEGCDFDFLAGDSPIPEPEIH